jgi:hypothetical protein
MDFGIRFADFSRRFFLCENRVPITSEFLLGRASMNLATEVPPASALEETTARVAEDIVKQHRSHLRDLEILLTRRGVILHGLARSYYGKQLAFHEVSRRLGMRVIANHIVVQT